MNARLARVSAVGTLITIASAACASVTGPDEVRIRIHNTGVVDFESVVVDFPTETEDYGPVAAGDVTGYRSVDKAYRYARIEVVVAGRTLVLQPIDYVGETPLEPGRYTYRLEADGPEGPLHLLLAEHDG